MNTVDIRRLDFTLLLVFQTVLQTGRTTLAARRLGLSQSAVSHALGRLRDALGDPLFLRRANGLEPTEAARQIAPRVAAIIAMAEDVLGGRSAFDPMASDRIFRLAANDYVASLLGPAIRARLAAGAPRAGISIRFAVGAAAVEAVRNGEVDLALGRFGAQPDDIEPLRLGAEGYMLGARRGHPAVAAPLDLDGYLALEHLLVSFRGDFRGTADLALSRMGERRRISASVPMFLTAFALVRDSDLVVTAPARLLHAFAPAFGLELRTLPFEIPEFDVQLLTARSRAAAEGRDWFVSLVRDAWADLDQASNKVA